MYPEMIRELINSGANVDEKDDRGRTPLYLAVRYSIRENVIELLNHGADLDQTNNEGTTVLNVAETDEMRQLIESYFDCEIKEPGQF
jgi:ankyrin repeat protein